MLNDLIPGVSGITALAVVCIILFSYFANRVVDEFNFKNETKILNSCRFVFPCLFSVLFTAVFILQGEFEKSKAFSTFCTFYGTSVLAYEAVLKRVLPAKSDKESSDDTKA